MWQKIIQHNDPINDFELESQAYEYTIGEPLPSKPEYLCSDGGLLVTILVPTLFIEFETSFGDKESPLFEIYKYLPQSVDKAELYHQKVYKDLPSGSQRINCNIYMSPGRYYFRLTHCKMAVSRNTSFSPENKFIQMNDSTDEKLMPVWRSIPVAREWRGFFDLKFRIRKADLYLGYEDKMLADHHLLYGAFYHSIDGIGIVRTFIYNGKTQLIEGQKI
jgi:hypothetical protein